MNNTGKNFAVWVIVALVLVLLFNMFEGGQKAEKTSKIPYSEFLKLVDNDKINDVSMVGRNIVGHLDDGSKFSTYTPPNDPNLIEKLSKHNIVINAAPEEEPVSPLLGLFFKLVTNAFIYWYLDFFHEANAGWPWRSFRIWKVKSQIINRKARKSDL